MTWENKEAAIIKTIKNGIQTINDDINFRQGPTLHFYRRTISNRINQTITDFINSDENIELLYATLACWDMNVRGAKMKEFDGFKENIRNSQELIKKTESAFLRKINQTIKQCYDKLSVMKSQSRMVANSKLLHLFFPDTFLPIDGKHTLNFFYGNTSNSFNKFLQIQSFAADFIVKHEETIREKIDPGWNTTAPKVIDNAIILIQRGK